MRVFVDDTEENGAYSEWAYTNENGEIESVLLEDDIIRLEVAGGGGIYICLQDIPKLIKALQCAHSHCIANNL